MLQHFNRYGLMDWEYYVRAYGRQIDCGETVAYAPWGRFEWSGGEAWMVSRSRIIDGRWMAKFIFLDEGRQVIAEEYLFLPDTARCTC